MIDKDVFRNKQAFSLWSQSALHNDLNCLMSGGNFFENDKIIIQPDTNFSRMEIIQGEKVTPFSNSICSYINVVDDIVYYRKDSERSIFRYSIQKQTEELVYSGNVGEIFVYGNYLYFIDLENEQKIMQISLDNLETVNCIVDESVKQFMIYSDQCVYLTKSNNIYQKTVAMDTVASNIPGTYLSFFFNGNIITQSGDCVLSFDIIGGSTKIIYENKDIKFRLAGASEGYCYIQEGKILKKVSTTDIGEIVSLQGEYGDYINSLIETKDSLRAIGYAVSENGTVQKTIVEFHITKEN